MSQPGEERVALVTGGSRGIGRAVVEALAEEGWQVFFCSRHASSVAQAVAALSGRFGERVTGEAVDVRESAEVEAFVRQVEAWAGRIDCLVNNAGLGLFGPVDQLSATSWREVIGTNLDGCFYFLRAVAPGMRRRGGGFIFNIGSLAARNPFAGGAAYNASKFGLLGLSEAAMLDLRKDGVKVAAILPGSVATEFGHPKPGERDWMLQPVDVARTVMDLLRYPDRALPSVVELRPTRPPKP
ncbi:MAG TPA: SDR family oxidoreductase [Thermoanaerobaculia bacterium]|nr:SDR family oxidoreductase [Thermoanaerobaculia bacterium]